MLQRGGEAEPLLPTRNHCTPPTYPLRRPRRLRPTCIHTSLWPLKLSQTTTKKNVEQPAALGLLQNHILFLRKHLFSQIVIKCILMFQRLPAFPDTTSQIMFNYWVHLLVGTFSASSDRFHSFSLSIKRNVLALKTGRKRVIGFRNKWI